MAGNQKIDILFYSKIKAYSQTHTNRETAGFFNIGLGTVSAIKGSSSYNSYREKVRELGRKYYTERKIKIKESVGEISNPFSGAIEPEPIIPEQMPVVESKNGEAVTVGRIEETKEEIIPFTIDQYREAYDKQKTEIKELKDQNETLKAEVQHLFDELNKKATSIIDKSPVAFSSTKVEIKVGDAHIIVTGGKNEE